MFWKERIKRNTDNWLKNLSNTEHVRKGNVRLRQREQDYLTRKPKSEVKETSHVLELLKQKIKSVGIKTRRHGEKRFQFKQSKLFELEQTRTVL